MHIYSIPTSDNENCGEVFLPDSPHTLLTTGKFQDVPLIAGISSQEGMLALSGEYMKHTVSVGYDAVGARGKGTEQI
jgi:hypothetical protein